MKHVATSWKQKFTVLQADPTKETRTNIPNLPTCLQMRWPTKRKQNSESCSVYCAVETKSNAKAQHQETDKVSFCLPATNKWPWYTPWQTEGRLETFADTKRHLTRSNTTQKKISELIHIETGTHKLDVEPNISDSAHKIEHKSCYCPLLSHNSQKKNCCHSALKCHHNVQIRQCQQTAQNVYLQSRPSFEQTRWRGIHHIEGRWLQLGELTGNHSVVQLGLSVRFTRSCTGRVLYFSIRVPTEVILNYRSIWALLFVVILLQHRYQMSEHENIHYTTIAELLKSDWLLKLHKTERRKTWRSTFRNINARNARQFSVFIFFLLSPLTVVLLVLSEATSKSTDTAASDSVSSLMFAELAELGRSNSSKSFTPYKIWKERRSIWTMAPKYVMVLPHNKTLRRHWNVCWSLRSGETHFLESVPTSSSTHLSEPQIARDAFYQSIFYSELHIKKRSLPLMYVHLIADFQFFFIFFRHRW